jgi:hypothetical protein
MLHIRLSNSRIYLLLLLPQDSWSRIYLLCVCKYLEMKQRKLESARVVSMNSKLAAFNSLLMEENERLA